MSQENLTWWTPLPDEIYWMEITRRDDLGSDLMAPLRAVDGRSTPGYDLLDHVRAGDIIVHYNSVESCISGVSRASGARYFEPILWAARGATRRTTGMVSKPTWVPGMYVAVEGYIPLIPAIFKHQIQDRKHDILAVGEAIRSSHAGPTYFPFTKYGNGIRAFQSYFAKFPSDLLAVFPELGEAVENLQTTSLVESIDPEVAAAEMVAEEFAGKRRSRSGSSQGRSADPQLRAAVEAYSMNLALDYFSRLGTVVDTSKSESYDFRVEIGDIEWHVEVKGTTTLGKSVLLTPNEVAHAGTFPHVALYVVSNITYDRGASGISVGGGDVSLFLPWTIGDGVLKPTGYELILSGGGERVMPTPILPADASQA